jgi:cysteine desulfurase
MQIENVQVKAMRDRLEKRLMEIVPKARINGGAAERLPNTTSIAFEFVEGEAILLLLSEFGICASSGSACTSGSLEPSHVAGYGCAIYLCTRFDPLFTVAL